MWCVPTEYLCQQHLQGEHAELHQLVGTILRHPNGMSVAEGHADEGNIDTDRIEQRHDKLVEEMESRGIEHDSPIEEVDVSIGEVDPRDNLNDLTERCDDCQSRVLDRMEKVEVGYGTN